MNHVSKRSLLCMLLIALLCFIPGCSAPLHATRDTSTDAIGSIHAIGSMRARRAAHTATLLPNGNVLIAGGFADDESGLASAELYDTATQTFLPTGSMTTARQSHTATMLPTGSVLIAGGFNGQYLSSVELYNPATGIFTPAGSMGVARSGHVTTLLKDGRVLFVGGTGVGWSFLASAELYDPATGAWTPTGAMAVPRESHTATMLAGGNVLITGGHSGRRQSITIYASAEIYDLATGTFRPTGAMTRMRHKHDAVLLPDGRVLIIGGADERDGNGAYSSAELFDPATGAFAATNAMHATRYKLYGTSVVLPNGTVLIAGGATRAEVFEPATETFRSVTGTISTTRLFATATLLHTGHVLVAGGYGPSSTASADAWLYSDDSTAQLFLPLLQ